MSFKLSFLDSSLPFWYLFYMNDRHLGYVILSLISLILIVAFSLLAWSYIKPGEIRTIVFDDVGSLKMQDPVRICGVPIGTVHDIAWRDKQVQVKIKTSRYLPIHQHYQIRAAADGIMGDRFIAIDPGNEKTALLDPKELLIGTLQTAPPDAIALIGSLHKKINTLKNYSLQLENGSVDKQSLIEQFSEVMVIINNLVTTLYEFILKVDSQFGPGIDTFTILMKDLLIVANKLSMTFPEQMAALQSLSLKTNELVTKVDTLMFKVSTHVDHLNEPDAILWNTTLSDLQEKVHLLQDIITSIEKDGLDLHVKPHF